MKGTFLFLVLLLAAHSLPAQKVEDPLIFEIIPNQTQRTVYAIIKDKQGFMWVSTGNGLCRYDGMEIKEYKTSFTYEKGMMRGRIVRSEILEDDQEQLWFATDVCINVLNKKKNTFSQQKLNLSDNTAEKEEEGDKEVFANPLLREGHYLWLASIANGLFAVNTQNGKTRHYPVPFFNETGARIPLMYNGSYDGISKLWFAGKQGLYSFDIKKHEWEQFLPQQSFYAAAINGDSLYAGNETGIYAFNIQTRQFRACRLRNKPKEFPPGLIRRIYVDPAGNIWAGDQKGNVYEKKRDGHEFNWRGNINGTSPIKTHYPVYCFYSDSLQNLWIGADVLGLLKANTNPSGFFSYPVIREKKISSQNLFVYSAYEDEKGKLWLGTFQNGLIILDKEKQQTTTVSFPYYNSKLPYAQSVPLIKEDSFGNLLTSYSGLFYIREKGAQHFMPINFPLPPSALQSPQLYGFTQVKDGWILATNLGLYKLTKTPKGYQLRYNYNFGQSKALDIWTSPTGNLWVIMENSGLRVLKNFDVEADKMIRLFEEENIKGLQYDTLANLVWLATTNGLIAYHLPTGTYKVYTTADGLTNEFIYGLLLHRHQIWLSTNNGLMRGQMHWKPKQLFPQIDFLSYTEAEGVNVSEFNTNAFYKSKTGIFYFGNTNGVLWFNPDKVSTSFNLPQIRLIDFAVNNQPVDSLVTPEYLSSVKLLYHQNNLFLRFRGIDFNNPEGVKYQYQLQGWDKKWVASNNLNQVRYNNLPPGHYTFKIKAANGAGIWSKDEYRLSIAIDPPFWQSWWFYSLVFILIVTAVILLTKTLAQRKLKRKLAVLERQRELDNERIRISREMHDDIGSGLTQITLMSESIKNKLKNKVDKEAEDIASTSRALVNSMNEIIWSLNPENKTLDLLLSYMRESLNKQLEYAGLEYTIDLPDNGQQFFLSNEQRRNILLVTKEVVNNVIKHSKATTVTIQAELVGNNLQFSITDNGIGISEHGNSGGNGLKNIKQRIKDMQGTLSIESGQKRGTGIYFSLPLSTT
jgi:signal transduction histidine kinase/streptogramin lyase